MTGLKTPEELNETILQSNQEELNNLVKSLEPNFKTKEELVKSLEFNQEALDLFREFRLVKAKKTQVWKIGNLGEYYAVTHGQLDGKMQFSYSYPGSKKGGSTAFMSAEANNQFNIDREIKNKIDKGYKEYLDGSLLNKNDDTITSLDFSQYLPKNFSASKPQTSIEPKKLTSLHNQNRIKYTRKYDGQCYIFVKHTFGWQAYSRRIELETEKLPNHIKYLESLNFEVGTILVGELIYQVDGKDNFKQISSFCRSLPEECRNVVNSLGKEPTFIIFDILFYNGEDLKNTSYKDRFKYLDGKFDSELIRLVDSFDLTPETWMKYAIDNEFEGFVGVDIDFIPGDKFYSFDGDPKRHAGNFKLKRVMTEDVVIFAGVKGSGKRLNTIGAVFVKQIHPDTGKWVNYGKCGSGFREEDLEIIENLLKEKNIPILNDDKEVKNVDLNSDVGVVVEIEFSERMEGTGKFRFPVFLRIRDDKGIEECIANL